MKLLLIISFLKNKVISKKRLISFFVLIILFLLFWFSLPDPLFNTPTSTLLEDAKGDLISAKIADDGQWRFPSPENIPKKFNKAITTFEDKGFDHHWGVDFFALGNAIFQNIKEGRIVRGGSTLTMQVIRLSRKNKKRTFVEKAIEMLLALRLEISYSKEEILKMYAKEAPFGGNIVGLEGASWRYFGRSPEKLSWSESATLAVLPNSPSLIFPGKNQEKLKAKRDRLLKQLYNNKIIDKTSFELSLQEPLPDRLLPIPSFAPHLLVKTEKDGKRGQRNKSSVNLNLQKRVNSILARHQERLIANGVYNAAALVLDVETGTVLSYGANIPGKKEKERSYDVDLIQAPRSTGSILKPLLFSMMVAEGKYLSNSLVSDIPTLINGYSPKNFYMTFDGAVPFKSAISRSLNVPSVRLLQEYGIEKFHSSLKKLGMTTLRKPANHYGLSIILGGAEGTLWDLANIYRGMAYNLNYYHKNLSQFPSNPFSQIRYTTDKIKSKSQNSSKIYPLTASSIWFTFEAMNEVSRPEEEGSWKDFVSGYKIAWKTGTSFGNRDGWAIGCTPQYVVAVWTGNANGEGRPELTGIGSAAPIMFEIFKLLSSNHWFLQPFNDMTKVKTCRSSGFKASEICKETSEEWISKSGLNSPFCLYCKNIYLDKENKYRVNSNCETIMNLTPHSWFVLPPSMEYYYKAKNAIYRTLPPFRSDCNEYEKQLRSMEIVYPIKNSKIYVPIELDGKPGKTVFQVAHRQPQITLFWYLNNYYLGTTRDYHEFATNPEAGYHTLTVTDERGESKEISFEILSNN